MGVTMVTLITIAVWKLYDCMFQFEVRKKDLRYHMKLPVESIWYITIYTGWWYTYPSQNISQLGLLLPIYGKSKKNHVPNQQPVYIYTYIPIKHAIHIHTKSEGQMRKHTIIYQIPS